VAGRVVCLLEGRVVLRADTSEVTREQVTEAYFGLSRSGGAG
jgi:branched-chain amino acid transport system ATP-binding protein